MHSRLINDRINDHETLPFFSGYLFKAISSRSKISLHTHQLTNHTTSFNAIFHQSQLSQTCTLNSRHYKRYLFYVSKSIASSFVTLDLLWHKPKKWGWAINMSVRMAIKTQKTHFHQVLLRNKYKILLLVISKGKTFQVLVTKTAPSMFGQKQ